MADPFVAEIRIFPFNFAPKGWAFCNGQLLPISQNTALFSLLGTTYGGDGKSQLRAARPAGQARRCIPGQGPGLSLHDLGETGGSGDRHAAASPRSRPHATRCGANDRTRPTSARRRQRRIARSQSAATSTSTAAEPPLADGIQALAPAGGDQPHNNMQPYLTLYFCIALQGVFPPRT